MYTHDAGVSAIDKYSVQEYEYGLPGTTTTDPTHGVANRRSDCSILQSNQRLATQVRNRTADPPPGRSPPTVRDLLPCKADLCRCIWLQIEGAMYLRVMVHIIACDIGATNRALGASAVATRTCKWRTGTFDGDEYGPK